MRNLLGEWADVVVRELLGISVDTVAGERVRAGGVELPPTSDDEPTQASEEEGD